MPVSFWAVPSFWEIMKSFCVRILLSTVYSEEREKKLKMEKAVDEVRRRFGFYSLQRGIMHLDENLSAVNAREDHIVHPRGYFGQ